MSAQTFGAAITAARIAKHYTQRELAWQVQMSPQYLNDIERDRRIPAPEFVSHLAQALGIGGEYLTFLADRWPESLRKLVKSEEDFEAMVAAVNAALGSRAE